MGLIVTGAQAEAAGVRKAGRSGFGQEKQREQREKEPSQGSESGWTRPRSSLAEAQREPSRDSAGVLRGMGGVPANWLQRFRKDARVLYTSCN